MTGTVATFYSYKGGVGRSFALANAATILAQWGLRVLMIDWDIEAPGLTHYFSSYTTSDCPGVIDFLVDCRDREPMSWDQYVSSIDLSGLNGSLHLMPAARSGREDYTRIVQELDWEGLYSVHNLGARLEKARSDWIENFDLVLIDSRTGITDFTGITTVQLPDLFLFFFTANQQSLQGCCDVARRALNARSQLPIDRAALVPIPIPARFEMREEYDRANAWRTKFADELKEFFHLWAPKSVSHEVLIDNLLIPYVPRWSFGEELAALVEPPGTNGLRSASYPVTFAIETLSALLAGRLQRIDLFNESRDEFVLTAKTTATDLFRNRTQRRQTVFISYTRDQAGHLVNDLIQELQDAGYDVWYDQRLLPGDLITDVIQKRLMEADALLVVVGSRSSKWQQLEVEAFIRQSLRGEGQRPVVPLVLPGAMSVLRESRLLAQFQAYELRERLPTKEQFSTLIMHLKRLLSGAIRTDGDEKNEIARGMIAGEEFERQNKIQEAQRSYQDALAAAERAAPVAYRPAMVAREKLGQLAAMQGNVSEALDQYTTALQLAQRGLSESLEDVEWRHAIARLNHRIGRLQLMRGDYSGARARLEEALSIATKLAPDEGQYYNQMLSLTMDIGDTLLAVGDVNEALKRYEIALEIAQQGSRPGAESDGSVWKSILNGKIGEVYVTRGDFKSALGRYEEALRLSLGDIDRGRPNANALVYGNLNSIGEIYQALGLATEALQHFESAIAVARKELASGASHLEWQQALSTSLINIADVLKLRGDASGALRQYSESLALVRQAESQNPSHFALLRERSRVLGRIADLQKSQGDFNAASSSLLESITVAERLASLEPANSVWLRDLAVSYVAVAELLEQAGDNRRAVENYRRGQQLFHRLGRMVGDDRTLSLERSKIEEGIRRLGG